MPHLPVQVAMPHVPDCTYARTSGCEHPRHPWHPSVSPHVSAHVGPCIIGLTDTQRSEQCWWQAVLVASSVSTKHCWQSAVLSASSVVSKQCCQQAVLAASSVGRFSLVLIGVLTAAGHVCGNMYSLYSYGAMAYMVMAHTVMAHVVMCRNAKCVQM